MPLKHGEKCQGSTAGMQSCYALPPMQRAVLACSMGGRTFFTFLTRSWAVGSYSASVADPADSAAACSARPVCAAPAGTSALGSLPAGAVWRAPTGSLCPAPHTAPSNRYAGTLVPLASAAEDSGGHTSPSSAPANGGPPVAGAAGAQGLRVHLAAGGFALLAAGRRVGSRLRGPAPAARAASVPSCSCSTPHFGQASYETQQSGAEQSAVDVQP